MNKLLVRQIKKYLRDSGSKENIQELFKAISESYDHYEKDRKMLERSIELTSSEMIELNNKLRKETEENSRIIYDKLKESLTLLSDESNTQKYRNKNITLDNIADVLKNEIIKRRKAENRTKRNELHLRASQRIAHVGSWEFKIHNAEDKELLLIPAYFSDETYRILGYKHNTAGIQAKVFYERIHPEDYQAVTRELYKSIDTGSVFDMEHRVLQPGGKSVMVHSRAEVIYEAGTQKPLRILGTIQDITSRKKAEEQLQKSNHELKTLFENMQEVYYSVDMITYDLIQISKSCKKVYGYSVSEFMKNPNLWSDVILEEDLPVINSNYPVMNAGKSFRQTYRIKHKNGSVRWLTSYIKPTMQNDKLVRIDGITSDITQSKEAEIALRNSEYKFRSLIENSTDAIMVVDEQSVVSYASDSLYRIMGYKPQEVIGTSSFKHIHPDDLHILHKQLDDVLNNPGVPFTIVYRRVKKDGNYIWCEGTATNLMHIPSVNGIVVIFRDITERKKAEKALKDSERKFRSLIENGSDVVTVLNEKQEIIYVSDSIKKVTGYLPEEVLAVHSINFVHPDDRSAAQKCWLKLHQTPGSIEKFIYRRQKKDGSYIWVESIVTNLLHDPVLHGVVINFRDISERMAYEQELKSSNNELVKSNRELDKFVYSVSHDLRAPLSSVLGLVEYATTETEDENMLENLRLIKTSINKLDGFVQDILDYSRNARTGVQQQKIDFNELLGDVTDNLKFMSSGKGDVTIKKDVQSTSDFYSDRSRLYIILNNLISNAIRYYNPDAAEPFVDVSITTDEQGAKIIISDNGVGIDEKYHEKIFEMFFRVSKKSVGSGLGLYIVKEAVERLEGKINLVSEKDKGTTFTVIIPANL